jgi:hypothetical protein
MQGSIPCSVLAHGFVQEEDGIYSDAAYLKAFSMNAIIL